MENEGRSGTWLAVTAMATVVLAVVAVIGLRPQKKPGRPPAPSDSVVPRPETSQVPTGRWSGYLHYTDRGVKAKHTLSIDFDNGTARTSGNADAGRILSVTSSVIAIDWSRGGREQVTYSVDAGVLTASGSVQAYSDGRTLPSSWRIETQ